MYWNQWEQYYETIIVEMGVDKKKDELEAIYWNKIVNKAKNSMKIIDDSISETKKRFKTNNVFIFGAGPSLIGHLDMFQKNSYLKKKHVIISSDGATQALIENDIVPDIVCSDFDGDMESIIEAGRKEIILFLHAHGDNHNLIEKWFPRISQLKYWIPTVQSKPIPPLIQNYGGFTDGDRALSLALHFTLPCSIILFGFDFGNIIGKYSKPYLKNNTLASSFKQKKLQFAKKFITILGGKWYKYHEIIVFSERN